MGAESLRTAVWFEMLDSLAAAGGFRSSDYVTVPREERFYRWRMNKAVYVYYTSDQKKKNHAGYGWSSRAA